MTEGVLRRSLGPPQPSAAPPARDRCVTPLRPPCGGDAEGRGGFPIAMPIWSSPAPPLCHSVTSPPARKTFEKLLFSPLAGEMPKAEGGLPVAVPIWSLAADPPLSLRDISPREGGRGDLRVLHWSLQGGAGKWVGSCLFEGWQSPGSLCADHGEIPAASAGMTEIVLRV